MVFVNCLDVLNRFVSHFQIRLSRQPTPYAKDIRDKIQHFRDVAVAKQHVHRGEMPQVYDNPLMYEEEEKARQMFFDFFYQR